MLERPSLTPEAVGPFPVTSVVSSSSLPNPLRAILSTQRYILDGLRVPVILNPALLDLIDDSPSTSGFTLQSKIDILYYQPSDLQISVSKHTR
jgi:hypothetical protein